MALLASIKHRKGVVCVKFSKMEAVGEVVSPAFHRFFEKKAVQKDRPHTFTYFEESLVLLEGKWNKY